MVPVFKNVGERSTGKNYRPVSLLSVVSKVIALNIALDISKAFDRVWHASLLHKLKSYGVLSQIFGLISSFFSNRRLRVVLDGKSSEEYPVNAGVPQGSILGPTLFLLYINGFPDDVICDIATHGDQLFILNVIRHLICGNI